MLMIRTRLVNLYNKIQEQVKSGKLKEVKISIDIDSQYDADDVIRAIHDAIVSLIDSWLSKPGHVSDGVDTKPVQVRVCVRDKCEKAKIFVNAELSDYDDEMAERVRSFTLDYS